MNVRFQKDGYIAKVLTWGMSPQKKFRYLNSNQNGCPMFWKFLFMFVWSLGGWRNDHAEQPPSEQQVPKKRNETIARINEKVSEFSETKTAQVVGKGIGLLFGGFSILILVAICGWVLFVFGSMVYSIFAGGWDSILGTGIVLGSLAVVGLVLYGLYRLCRWIASTEAWALFTQKAKSLKEKTCPVVAFA